MSVTTKQTEHARNIFGEALNIKGYKLVDYSRLRNGAYQNMRFQKVVNVEYLFTMHFYIQPSQLPPGRKTFGINTGVELMHELRERKPWLKRIEDLETSACAFDFGLPLEIERLMVVQSKYFS